MSARLLALCALLLVASPGVAPAQSPPSAPAVVTGRVTVAGKPAAGVTVMLLPANWGEDAGDGPKAATDAEGKYRLESAASGQFVVAASLPGYVGANDNRFGQPGKTVSIVAGEAIDGVDLELTRGGVITGRVTTADGRPVVGTAIQLFLLDAKGEPQRVYRSFEAETDDRGVYRAYGLAAGRYLVAAGQDENTFGIGTRALPLTYFPDAADRAGATPVTVEGGGEVRAIDIVAQRRQRTYTVSGRIVDAESGAPVADLPILNAVNFEGGATGFTDFGARSGPKGEFRLPGMKPGKYTVIVRPSPEDGSAYFGQSEPYTVADHDVVGLEVRVRKGAVLSGAVVVEGTSDPAVLASLAEVHLSVVPEPVVPGAQMNAGARLKADGSFQIMGVPAGRMRFGFWAPRVKGFSIVRVERDGAELPGMVFDVGEGESIAGFRVVFGYGTGAIRGEIKFEGGGAVGARTGVVVELVRTGAPGSRWVRIDDRGQFLAEGLVAGEYEVKVYDARKGWEKRVLLTSRPVTVAGDAPVRVTLAVDLGDATGGEQ